MIAKKKFCEPMYESAVLTTRDHDIHGISLIDVEGFDISEIPEGCFKYYLRHGMDERICAEISKQPVTSDSMGIFITTEEIPDNLLNIELIRMRYEEYCDWINWKREVSPFKTTGLYYKPPSLLPIESPHHKEILSAFLNYRKTLYDILNNT